MFLFLFTSIFLSGQQLKQEKGGMSSFLFNLEDMGTGLGSLGA